MLTEADRFPDGLGAVQHNNLSDAIVTLLVFHQLHCLISSTIIKDGILLTFFGIAIHDHWNGMKHSYMRIICDANTNAEYRESGVKETPVSDVKRRLRSEAARRCVQGRRSGYPSRSSHRVLAVNVANVKCCKMIFITPLIHFVSNTASL